MEFEIIIKKLNNTLTKKEEIIFDSWYDESPTHKDYFLKVRENYQKTPENLDVQKGWLTLEKKIEQKAKTKTYWKYAVAASVAVLISMALFFTKDNQQLVEPIENPTIVDRTIQMGTDKATLTLEDGSNVTLEKDKGYQADNLSSNGEELVYSAKNGLNSSAKAKIAYNYLTIPRGGEFFLQLSDGTKVWLNSESQIKYPVKFIEGQTRQVELIYGEAYFDVSPSTEHNGDSFKVNTQMQEVEVLGTEFNIKAYKDEDKITTTLVEGKVTIGNEGIKEYLKPNDQSIFNVKNKDIAIATVDVSDVISWRKGLFSFKDKSLKDITKVLARWYDIDVVFERQEVEEIKFNGVLNKRQEIESILSIINSTNNIAYEIKDKEVIFK
jgi:transmembrane sensor